MNKYIQVLKSHGYKLEKIFGNRLLDIVLYGSTVTGDYQYGQGDIDFLVFIDGLLTEDDEKKLYNLHDTYRCYNDLYSLLEGRYYSINNQESIYISSTRSRWKRENALNLSSIDQGMILQDHFLIYNRIQVDAYLSFDYNNIIEQIEKSAYSDMKTMDVLDDLGFDIHVCHSSTRSLYYLEHKQFTSKSNGIEAIIHQSAYIQYGQLLKKLQGIRFPYKIYLTDQERVLLKALDKQLLNQIITYEK